MQDSELRPDEQSIPLLEDVVDPEEIDNLAPAANSVRSRIPDQQTLIHVLREGIATQLNQELAPIIAAAVNKAVEQVTEQTRRLLQDELNGSLEHRLRLLINTALDNEFKSKPQK